MPDSQDAPAATAQTPPTSPIVMGTPIHDQIADHLGVRQKHRRSD
ncbi:hypothetical protein [Lentzea californiensis]|jgi:hypothetical protein|nr:hypothetical protein [Lentzea californiensis]